jgi:hypothetical protein
MKNRYKAAYGGKVRRNKGRVKLGYGLESPLEALVENEKMNIKALDKIENNEWFKFLESFAQVSLPVGGALAGLKGGQRNLEKDAASDINTGNIDTTETRELLQNDNSGIKSELKDQMNSMMNYAYGGQLGRIPAEVEGGEVAQTPYGDLLQFFGNSHEQGGIDIDLPEGTDVFSKRIKIDNVTLADRKKKREARLKRLQKKLEKNRTDALLKNTLLRTEENNQKEEGIDKSVQEMVRKYLSNYEPGIRNYELGENPQQYAGGGIVGFPSEPYDNIVAALNNPYNKNLIKKNEILSLLQQAGIENLKPELSNDSGQERSFYTQSIEPKAPEINVQGVFDNWKYNDEGMIEGLNSFLPISPTKESNVTGIKETIKRGSNNNNSNPNGFKDKSWTQFLGYMPTVGDMAGIYGNLFQGYAPYNNTLANRAGDLPNVNSYQNFGENTLKTLNDQRSLLEQNRARQMSDLTLARNASVNRNRNSAMGINTQRALDLASDMELGRIGNQVDMQYNQQLAQLMNMIAQSQGIQDQVRMGGEERKLEADKADRDAYYTQIAKDLANLGGMYSETGKTLNQIKTRGDILRTQNEMFDNVGYSPAGFYGKQNSGKNLLDQVADFTARGLYKNYPNYKTNKNFTAEEWNALSETEKGLYVSALQINR